jgi:hypothetical protein
MDLQADMTMKDRGSLISRFTVTCCLVVTAALLISSLVSPKPAPTEKSHNSPSPLSSPLTS